MCLSAGPCSGKRPLLRLPLTGTPADQGEGWHPALLLLLPLRGLPRTLLGSGGGEAVGAARSKEDLSTLYLSTLVLSTQYSGTGSTEYSQCPHLSLGSTLMGTMKTLTSLLSSTLLRGAVSPRAAYETAFAKMLTVRKLGPQKTSDLTNPHLAFNLQIAFGQSWV